MKKIKIWNQSLPFYQSGAVQRFVRLDLSDCLSLHSPFTESRNSGKKLFLTPVRKTFNTSISSLHHSRLSLSLSLSLSRTQSLSLKRAHTFTKSFSPQLSFCIISLFHLSQFLFTLIPFENCQFREIDF